MYAIVEISGKQYRVSKDMKIKVPRLDSEPGKKVGFDKILFVEDEKGKTTVGSPLINNMLVNATVVEHGRDKKVIIFKKKRRKGHQKRQGHRQGYSIIEINTIGAGSVKKATPPPKAKVAEEKTETPAAKTAKPAAAKTAAKKPAASAKPKTVKEPAAKVKAATVAEKPAAKKAAAPKKTAVKKETKPAAKEKKED